MWWHRISEASMCHPIGGLSSVLRSHWSATWCGGSSATSAPGWAHCTCVCDGIGGRNVYSCWTSYRFPTTRGQASEWDCCAIIGLRAGAIGIMATERANYAFNSSFSSIFGMSGANLDLRFVTLPYVVIHYRVRQQKWLPFRRYDMFVKLVSH